MNLEKKIEKTGVTKKHISKMVGINNATLSRIISGKQSSVSNDLMKRINDYLDSIDTTGKKNFKKIIKNI